MMVILPIGTLATANGQVLQNQQLEQAVQTRFSDTPNYSNYGIDTMSNSQNAILDSSAPAAEPQAVDGPTYAASSTGRNTDKIEKLGIKMQSVPGSDIQIPEHTRIAIQCTLKEYHEVGDHYLYICNVEQVFADESEEALFAWNGYAKIATAKQGE